MLRNLDLRAYHDVLHDMSFQEDLIPRQAKHLAARFSTALAPLFVNSQSQSEGNVFHSWGEDQEVWKDRRSCLQRIFTAALKLKTETVTAQKCFEFVLHPVGSLYTGGTIEDATGENVMQLGARRIHLDLEYWLHASLNTYEIEATNCPGQLADFTVQPNNFLTDHIRAGSMTCSHRKNIMIPKPPTNMTYSENERRTDSTLDESSRLQISQQRSQGVMVSPNFEVTGREIESRRRALDESATRAQISTRNTTTEGQSEGRGNALKEVPPEKSYGRRKKKIVSGKLSRKKGRRNVTSHKQPTCDRCSATFCSLSNLARHQQDGEYTHY